MKTLFITSRLDTYDKDENGNKIPHNFGNKNNILTNLKKHIKKYDNMLIVASDQYDTQETDIHVKTIIGAFELTLPFKNYALLDCRTEKDAKQLVENADLVYLMGGHAPTQRKFFDNIKLKEIMQNYDGVVLGISAGSINSATTVYCPPELEGEGYDKNFQRFYAGLGLTNINIYPHFSVIKDIVLDGKKMIDYLVEDSAKLPILVLEDGSYFIQKENEIELYGKSYKLFNKSFVDLCQDNQCVKIDEKL